MLKYYIILHYNRNKKYGEKDLIGERKKTKIENIPKLIKINKNLKIRKIPWNN